MKWYISSFIFIVLLFSCAQQYPLEGGAKDTVPPIVVLAKPNLFSTNVDINIKNIKIFFNKHIILKNISQIIISPTLEPIPLFSPLIFFKKNINIKFLHPLKKNTTYIINFGESIQDSTEGNKLPFFKYIFSTGPHLDSIEINGKVIDAYERTLDENIIVGLYKVDDIFNDMFIYKQRPYYFTKADEEGRYKITNIKEGSYFLIAFSQDEGNYIYNPEKGKLAFESNILNLRKNGFYQLRLFKEITPFKRLTPKQVSIGHIEFPFKGSIEGVYLKSNQKFYRECFVYDTKASIIHYWYNLILKEEKVKKLNKLDFKFFIHGKSENLSVILDKKNLLDFSLKEISQTLSPIKPAWFISKTPIYSINQNKIKVLKNNNGSLQKLNFRLLRPKNNLKKIGLCFSKELSSKYDIILEPEAIEDIVGNKSPLLKFTQFTGEESDYGHLEINLSDLPNKPFWLQLLDKDNKVVEEFYGRKNYYMIRYLEPKTYYLRILVDKNEDKKWNSGNLFLKQAPEPVFFYEKPLQINSFWNIQENWKVLVKPSHYKNNIPLRN